jgi:phage gp46-like protein
MDDIKIIYDKDGYFDIDIKNGDIQTDEDIETAVLISLFCDRRANDDEIDVLDKRGWYGDLYSIQQNDKTGSKLWLLKREKLTALTIARIRNYSNEALAHLVEDKRVKDIDVNVEKLATEAVLLTVKVTLFTNEIKQYQYDYSLGY